MLLLYVFLDHNTDVSLFALFYSMTNSIRLVVGKCKGRIVHIHEFSTPKTLQWKLIAHVRTFISSAGIIRNISQSN